MSKVRHTCPHCDGVGYFEYEVSDEPRAKFSPMTREDWERIYSSPKVMEACKKIITSNSALFELLEREDDGTGLHTDRRKT